MSLSASGYTVPDVVELSVVCLNGEECKLSLSSSALGQELHQIVSQQLPSRKGRRTTVQHGNSRLMLGQTLQEQGIVGTAVTLSATFVPTDVYAAWRYIQGLPVPDGALSLEGLTRISGISPRELLQLPKSLEILGFGKEFNQSLQGVTFPSGLQRLTFGRKFNQSLEGVALPSGLQRLTFGENFNQSLEGVALPSGLQSLTFGENFNQSLEGVALPSGLQSFTFGGNFNQSPEGVALPSGLQSLTFGSAFNQSLQSLALPSGLQKLSFGENFNQSLQGVDLPSCLQSLTFGRNFNQSLEGVALPSSLQSLTLGRNFNQSLEGVALPSGLQSLTFGGNFNQSPEGVALPSGLQSLTFGTNFNQSLEGVALPSGLQSLTFGGNFNQSPEGVALPSGLQSLTFGANFNQSLEGVALPSGLQRLTFGENFNQSMEGVALPSGLQSLTFGWDFNQSLEGVALPSGLQSLTFGWKFNQSLQRVALPSGLQSLRFGESFNQRLEGVALPSGLQRLTFGGNYNQSLEGVAFPSGLKSLIFWAEFNQSLEGAILPLSCNTLGSALAVDIATETTVLHPKGGFGGLGGQLVQHLALGNVRHLRSRLDASIHVVGCGGVATGEDAFAHILCGATAVQVATQHRVEGPQCFERIASELRELMQRKGYTQLEDFRGKLRARLESERKVTGSERSYDEILVTEKLNAGAVHVEKLWVSSVPVHVFSEEVLSIMAHYLHQYPSSVQDDVVDGLVKDILDYFREDMKEVVELPALKNFVNDRTEKVRKREAADNRRRLEMIQDSMLALTNGAPTEVEALSLSRRGTGSKSASKLHRSKSNLTVVSEDQVLPIADGEEDDASFFPEGSQEKHRLPRHLGCSQADPRQKSEEKWLAEIGQQCEPRQTSYLR
eukprot:s3166_g4.t1